MTQPNDRRTDPVEERRLDQERIRRRDHEVSEALTSAEQAGAYGDYDEARPRFQPPPRAKPKPARPVRKLNRKTK